MEVYFLDVAQGTCQIILLGDRKAIVVDCGIQSDRTALRFLKRYGIEDISALIVTHSHSDHMGGALGILGAYQDRIERICIVHDSGFLNSRFWLRLSDLLRLGVVSIRSLVRLECTTEPQEVWKSSDGQSRLLTFSPTAAENLLATNQNATSAVLFLECGNSKIIFASDSQIEQWRQISARAKGRIDCNIIAVPHHAGEMAGSVEDLRILYRDIVHPQFAIVSVGTGNNHGHPRQEVIQALRDEGATVLCTQMTTQCTTDLERIRPGLLQPIVIIGQSSPTPDYTSVKKSRNVACAGTVRAVVAKDAVEIERVEQHATAVDSLASSAHGSPLCRNITRAVPAVV